jgi:hypothetical protein
LYLKALVSNIDGSQTITAQASALITHFGQAVDLGNVVADALIRDGAEHLIASLGN